MMSVDKAIRLARKWAAGHVCTLREGEAQEYHRLCAEALERSRWIPVTERLPEKYNEVLCYKDGRVRTGYYIGAKYAKEVAAFHSNHEQFAFGVTHWMPLPNKPKEE